ncbi:MAG: hypothetical protein H7241_12940 [Novosphingobium sp.]|nr:hypothetical protein [Novosphingobium sp.]
MRERIGNFDAAITYALSLPVTELSTSYSKPAAKTAANRQGFLFIGHEPDPSFCLRLLVDILIETGPETFWQSPHYVGHAALLVRFDSPDPGPDPDRVCEAIAQAQEMAVNRKPRCPRKQ